MAKFLATLILLISKSYACGIYEVKGVPRLVKNGIHIFVNENSLSAIDIQVPIPDEAKLSPYLNQPILASIMIKMKNKGQLIQGTILETDSRPANPLDPKDTGMKIISKADCQ